MQIAKIVPRIRTSGDGVFDYSIPPQILPDIKIGILVLVPFRGRKVEGIVIDIKRYSKFDTLKPIISIIDKIPAIDKVHTELARWMSNYYLAPFSKTLFENIVPPAKRTIKKQADNVMNAQAKTRNSSAKKYLIVADFQTRLKFYLQAIEKTLERNQQIIILVPDLAFIPYFERLVKSKISILHSNLTKTERWLEWDKIRRGDTKIIIGSNSALFSPVKNLGLIIIDQEENDTYKNDQSPRFHALTVAGELSCLTAANLVIGSVCPRVETYFGAQEGKYLLQKNPKSAEDVSIVDMNFERRIISQPLENKINKTLEAGKKVILVFNRKGEGRSFSCKDCGWSQTCPECKLPLVPSVSHGFCANCEKSFSLATTCPMCRSSNLASAGLGTGRLASIVKKIWPGLKISRLEKDSSDSEDWDIAIATSFALKKEFRNIGLVAILDLDQNQNLPDFFISGKTFETYYKFLRIGDTGLIQTHTPEQELIKSLGKLDYEEFYQTELKTRKKYSIPPFGRLIRLVFSHPDEKTCQEESDEIARKIKPFLKQEHLLGPNPTFRAKRHNKFSYQIMIKFEKLPIELKNILENLPSGWIVDVDPISSI